MIAQPNELMNDKGVCRAALALPGSANNKGDWFSLLEVLISLQ